MSIQHGQPSAFTLFIREEGIEQVRACGKQKSGGDWKVLEPSQAYCLLCSNKKCKVCHVLRRGSDRVRAHAARFLNLLLTHLAPALHGPTTEEDIGQAAQGVISVLGREASAMLHRRVDLADVQAEAKLAQLSNALQFFMG